MDLNQRLKEAADPTTSPERLAELAGDSSPEVRWLVARHQSTPAAALGRLASDTDPGVRFWVALHQSTQAEDMERLAADTHPIVWRVAQVEIRLRAHPR